MNKLELRRKFLKQRQQMPSELYQAMNRQICDQLTDTDLWRESTLICAYTSFRQEPDLSMLFASHSHKRWLFPRCVVRRQDSPNKGITAITDPPELSLTWHEVQGQQWQNLMVQGTYGIWEPRPDLPVIDFNLNLIDLILVPAVAADRRGYRLGYGAGFYDRWLPTQTAPTVGIVFSEFMVQELPHDPWDVPLNYLLTEQGLWHCQ